MPHLNVNGVEYFYRDKGVGPLVILTHAASSTSGQWKTLMERISDSFRLLAFDLAGYGNSGSLPGNLPNIYIQEGKVIQALANLQEGPVHLVGHSAGGLFTLESAIGLEKRLASLTLVEPVAFHLLRDNGKADAWEEIESVARNFGERLNAGNPELAMSGFVDYWNGPGSWNVMPGNIKEAALKTAKRVQLGFETSFSLQRPIQDYAKFDVPVLLVRGTQTTLAARIVVELLAQNLPHARTVEIEGAGHMSVLTHRDAVADHISDHLLSQI